MSDKFKYWSMLNIPQSTKKLQKKLQENKKNDFENFYRKPFLWFVSIILSFGQCGIGTGNCEYTNLLL